MIDEVTAQRIIHLKLQGFSVLQASQMQGVPIEEVYKIYNQDKVFTDEKRTKVRVESVK